MPTPELYREEAERVRHMAAISFNENVRQLLLDIAYQYEALARITERHRPGTLISSGAPARSSRAAYWPFGSN